MRPPSSARVLPRCYTAWLCSEPLPFVDFRTVSPIPYTQHERCQAGTVSSCQAVAQARSAAGLTCRRRRRSSGGHWCCRCSCRQPVQRGEDALHDGTFYWLHVQTVSAVYTNTLGAVDMPHSRCLLTATRPHQCKCAVDMPHSRCLLTATRPHPCKCAVDMPYSRCLLTATRPHPCTRWQEQW